MQRHIRASVLFATAFFSLQVLASGGRAPEKLEENRFESDIDLGKNEYVVDVSPAVGASCGWGAESAARKSYNSSVQQTARDDCAPHSLQRVLDYEVTCKSFAAVDTNNIQVPGCEGSPLTLCGVAADSQASAICLESAP